MNDEERLEQTFKKLRADDAHRVPSFEEVRHRRPRRRSPWATVVPLASAAAAAALFVVWCNVAPDATPATTAATPAPPPVSTHATVAAGEAETRERAAPLDFLLDVPGLRGTPDFDTSLLRGSLR